MWKIALIAFFLNVILQRNIAEGTLCYQCDSWEHRDCGEDDSLYDRDREFLVPCSPLTYSPSSQQVSQYSGTPNTCLKEVTYFLPGQIQGQLNPNNRYGRPHVLRHCGISLNLNQYSSGRTGGGGDEYYTDRCIKTEVIVNGLQAERYICSCSGDACNSSNRLTSAMLSSTSLIISLTVFLINRHLL